MDETKTTRGPGYWDCDCGRECHHKEGPQRLPNCRAEWVEWRNDELDAALNARHERKTQPAPCPACKDEPEPGRIEMPNNGPIVPCWVCNRDEWKRECQAHG